MLTKDQIDEYNENGFTILDYKLSEDDLENIKSAHKSLTDKHPEYIDYCPMLLAHDLNFLKYARDKNILECVCVQHEIDHLDSITMFDRIPKEKDFG